MTLHQPVDSTTETAARTPSSTRSEQEPSRPTTPPTRTGEPATTVAEQIAPLLCGLLGTDATGVGLHVRFEFWDGSTFGSPTTDEVVRVNSSDALRRLLWSPDELGLGRAYVAGDIDIDGDVFTLIATLRDRTPKNMTFRARDVAATVAAARRLGVVGRPLQPPPEEARPRGLRRHSKARDAKVISHHYDVGNDFYRIVLGPSMTYSCARFVDPSVDLASAQASKHDLVCRKLGLHDRPGQRLLDVGCGWGSMALHAAQHYGASVVGITISEAQASFARRRIAEAGLADQIEIRLQDYRDLGSETFDAISSIGMSEHVGSERIDTYFEGLRAVLGPHGRLLNHAISSVNGSKLGRRSFTYRYVFPDGELLDVGDTVRSMERAGFEVRDVECLREHYARTLRNWVANLEAEWERAVELAGEARAKVWRLYMAGSAVGFEDGGISLHQVLGVVPDSTGASAMPPTRDAWTTAV